MLVNSRSRWNDTGIDVASGEKLSVAATGQWSDGGVDCGPEGFEKPWLVPVRWTRRCREASWFELIAVVGQHDGHYHRIGAGSRFTAERSGRVYLFANDSWIMYWNNRGSIEVHIEAAS